MEAVTGLLADSMENFPLLSLRLLVVIATALPLVFFSL